MKKILLSLSIGLGVVVSLWAQPQAPPSKPPLPVIPGNKFLFVVDTSSGMRQLDLANRQTLFDLIYLGVNQQMQPQDTFGVWTFNNKVYAGEYRMQVWDTNKLLELASRATFFLKSKKYTGKCEMELLVFSLGSLLQRVKDVNILIVSDGATPMRGTPFDQPINLAYKQRAAEQRKGGKPFITTLIVRGGTIVSALVTLPGENILVPALPAIAQTPPAPAPPRSTAQPIIMKSAAAKQANPSVSPQNEIASSITATHIANSSALPAAVAKTVPADMDVGDSEATAADPKIHNTNAGNPVVSLTEAPTPKAKEEAPAKTAVLENHANPASTQASADVTPEITGPATEARVSESPKPGAQPTVSAPNVPTTGLETLASKPLGVTSPESVAGDAPRPNVSTALAVVTPKPIFSPKLLILAGGLLLAGALCLLILLFRRIQKIPEPSIITRSLENRP